jgi:uncharacterized membrane protein
MNKETSERIDEHKRFSLELVTNQIISFDNKTSIIVSVLGIIFALSFAVIEIIASKDAFIKPYIFSSFLMFLIAILTSLSLSILALMPRKRKGSNKKKSLTYYGDLIHITDDEYSKLYEANGYCCISIEQINQNSRICMQKHLLLKASIICLIPMTFFFLLTTILVIWM